MRASPTDPISCGGSTPRRPPFPISSGGGARRAARCGCVRPLQSGRSEPRQGFQPRLPHADAVLLPGRRRLCRDRALLRRAAPGRLHAARGLVPPPERASGEPAPRRHAGEPAADAGAGPRPGQGVARPWTVHPHRAHRRRQDADLAGLRAGTRPSPRPAPRRPRRALHLHHRADRRGVPPGPGNRGRRAGAPRQLRLGSRPQGARASGRNRCGRGRRGFGQAAPAPRRPGRRR